MSDKRTLNGFADTHWLELLMKHIESMKVRKLTSLANNIMASTLDDITRALIYVKALSDFRRDLENEIKTFKEE